MFEQLGADHNYDRTFAKENGFVDMLRSIRIHVEDERSKPPSENRLGSSIRGGKTAFKLENLARFYKTKDDLSNYEAMFQLAFMDADVFALLDDVMKKFEKRELKGMQQKKQPRKALSATERGEAFLSKAEMTSSYLKELPSLQNAQQTIVLNGVIRGQDTLSEMCQKIKIMKEMDDVKACFAKVAGKAKWLDVDAKYLCRITDVELEGYRMAISTYMKKLRTRSKKVSGGGVAADPPHQFVEFVHNKTRPEMYAKGSKSVAWEQTSPETIRRMLTHVNTFDGTKFTNQTLKDGTKVVRQFRYRVVCADSCDRSWIEKKVAVEEAKRLYDQLKRDVGHQVDSMEVEAKMLTLRGSSSDQDAETVDAETVMSWINREEFESWEETDESRIKGNVSFVYV